MSGKRKEHQLSPEIVREIREEIAAHPDRSARQIAIARGLPERTVQNVTSGRTFIDAGGPLRHVAAPERLQLTDEQVRRIRVLKGFRTSKLIAEQFKCSEAAVRAIWTGRMRAAEGRQPFGGRALSP